LTQVSLFLLANYNHLQEIAATLVSQNYFSSYIVLHRVSEYESRIGCTDHTIP